MIVRILRVLPDVFMSSRPTSPLPNIKIRNAGTPVTAENVASHAIASTDSVAWFGGPVAAPVAHWAARARVRPASKARPPLAQARFHWLPHLSPSPCSLRRGFTDLQ
ncbi:hypothetical protein POX_c04636 [Penicillium oxalicum]|uniref:hypothetical protein n=1 Tax=Penicillium oxalicum TaxID=69781 RepID=UPI0020B6B705|nr:hypothetical protein POX_c04636 [Penicillium oxalicum]KAI2791758.1 hypothetical protein POX_c04636 [Penicillium oxalicum]